MVLDNLKPQKKAIEAINLYLRKSCVTIDELLDGTDALLFGGAIRDALTGVPINDLDIIGFTKSIQDITDTLDSWGFDESKG
ncbi:MAG: hypothetical protein GY804_02710, partial [Alphaproteobacteria bacterium]|nr:hypothetical protein [Alphaproteobacteria bacterium]